MTRSTHPSVIPNVPVIARKVRPIVGSLRIHCATDIALLGFTSGAFDPQMKSLVSCGAALPRIIPGTTLVAFGRNPRPNTVTLHQPPDHSLCCP
jgi:hypothetical protein